MATDLFITFHGSIKQFALTVLLALVTILLSAQTGVIDGHVVNKQNSETIPGAIVWLDGLSIHTTTNSNGYFILNEIPIGAHELHVDYLGFETFTLSITVGTGKHGPVRIELKERLNQLSEVVVISGGSSGLRDIPGSAHYISPKELDRFSYTDINRTLRAIPGVNLQEEDGFGLRPNIGLRATGAERSSKITIMEDGVLIAPAPYAAPAAYYFPTIGRMYAVEILKGSSQIKYGPFTTGGAINLITTPIPEELSGLTSISYGSFNSQEIKAQVGSSNKRFGFLVEALNYGSDGFKTLPSGSETGFNKSDYLGKLRWRTLTSAKTQQSITLKVGIADERSNETYLGITDDDFTVDPFQRYAASDNDLMITDQRQIAVTHNIEPRKGTNITTIVYRTDFHRNWYKLDQVLTDSGQASIGAILADPDLYQEEYGILNGISTSGGSLRLKANNRTYYARGVQTKLTHRVQRDRANHFLEVGLRLHEDQIDRFQWNDFYAMDNGDMQLVESGIPGTESNRVETARAAALHLQYKLEIGKTTVHPGVRFEHISIERLDYGIDDPLRAGENITQRKNTVTAWMPGFAVDHKFNEELSSFAGIHKGFAPPGSKEGAEPESSMNYEIGTRFRNSKIKTECVLFYSNYENLLGSDLVAAGGGGTNLLFNGGAAEAYGVEFQLSCDPLSSSKGKFRLPLSVVYTHTDATFSNTFNSEFEGWGNVESGDHLPYLANDQLAVIGSLQYDVIRLDVSTKYATAMRTEPGQEALNVAESTDTFLILDAAIDYRLGAQVSVFGTVSNLGNDTYIVARRPAGVRPGLPRSFKFGVKANF